MKIKNMRSSIKKIVESLKKVNLLNFLFIALLAVFLINIAVILQNKYIAAQKKAAAEELARPANIEIITVNDSSCAACADLNIYIDAVKKQNVKVAAEKTVAANSEEGKSIIKNFEITRLPIFVVKGELEKNDGLKNLLNRLGKIKDRVFVFTVNPAPYFDIASGKIKGAVNITLISDKSCAECQNAQIYKQILTRFGIMKFSTETNLDKSDLNAKLIIKKYKIEAVPTFILTGEISEYPNLSNTWTQVGTIEKDGAYVFRELKATGLTYVNLKTGKIVKPETATPTPSSTPKPK